MATAQRLPKKTRRWFFVVALVGSKEKKQFQRKKEY